MASIYSVKTHKSLKETQISFAVSNNRQNNHFELQSISRLHRLYIIVFSFLPPEAFLFGTGHAWMHSATLGDVLSYIILKIKIEIKNSINSLLITNEQKV